MAGHSKWKQIKHYKAAADAKRGALFTKLIREITMAAKIGGGDATGNARLRLAIETARSNSMPKENIERAIKKGTGELEGVNYEELTYEGYGPGGVAFVLEILTDNKNRTAGDVRAIFTKGGGSMAATGAVAFQFDRKGVIPVKKGVSEEQVMELALDAGADDVIPDGEGGFELRTDTGSLLHVHKALEGKLPVGAPKMAFIPRSTVQVSGETAEKVLRLVENLEENDDVQHVYANFEIPDDELAALESRA
jgi:YebC/PmpR family DNA-binding regulatory protein